MNDKFLYYFSVLQNLKSPAKLNVKLPPKLKVKRGPRQVARVAAMVYAKGLLKCLVRDF